MPHRDPVGRGRRSAPLALAVTAAVSFFIWSCGPAPTPKPDPTPKIVPVPSLLQTQLPSTARLDAAARAALQQALDALVTKYKIPGAEAALILPDGSEWTGTSGVAVQSTKQPMTSATLMSVGSISKTFTGAIALRLAESGAISLDDPLSKYLPSYPNAANITLRELMNHTSGIQDLFDPSVYRAIQANPSATWTADQLLAKIGRPYFKPGTDYHYSSTNYVILGQVIEKVTGQKLATLIRTKFLEPLGLSHTFLQSEEPISGTLAHGYISPKVKMDPTVDVSVGQKMLPYISAATATGASGAVVSTASDIAIWASALYGGKLFSETTLASMVDFSATAPFSPHIPYGLACEQLSLNSELAWGHRGHVDGFWSTMAYLPDSGITIALLTNADWINPLTPIASLLAAIPEPATGPN
jgi:D-alanyl-D-alanine carboxypeptidase